MLLLIPAYKKQDLEFAIFLRKGCFNKDEKQHKLWWFCVLASDEIGSQRR